MRLPRGPQTSCMYVWHMVTESAAEETIAQDPWHVFSPCMETRDVEPCRRILYCFRCCARCAPLRRTLAAELSAADVRSLSVHGRSTSAPPCCTIPDRKPHEWGHQTFSTQCMLLTPSYKATHILDSLLGAPPVTLATLRAPSSCFSSMSCKHSNLVR